MVRRFRGLNVLIKLSLEKVCIENSHGKEICSSDFHIDRTKDMHITNFFVQEEYRDKGYGHFLAGVLFEIAKLYICKTVSLVDGATHEGFWQSMGFKDAVDSPYSVKVL